MTKILVADDEVDMELLIKQKFRKHIREGNYEFIFDLHGNDALSKIQQHAELDMILCDIKVHDMDGLTLISKLNATNSLLNSVIVSA